MMEICRLKKISESRHLRQTGIEISGNFSFSCNIIGIFDSFVKSVLIATKCIEIGNCGFLTTKL